MAEPNPFYDVLTPLYLYAPGVVPTRDIYDGLEAQYAANGYTPITPEQVVAITGTPPAYPTGMKRFQDSNPCPRDNWAIDNKL